MLNVLYSMFNIHYTIINICLVFQSGMLAVLGGTQDGRTGSEEKREAKPASIKEEILL